jgi:hypothetical protein
MDAAYVTRLTLLRCHLKLRLSPVSFLRLLRLDMFLVIKDAIDSEIMLSTFHRRIDSPARTHTFPMRHIADL